MKILSLNMRKSDSWTKKLSHFHWPFLLLIVLISCIGFITLYSAANGHLSPWADKQMIRFGVGMGFLFFIALTDVRIWMRYAYPLYLASFILLIIVEAVGRIGGGSQRWINFYVFYLQPSEIMKITLILALSRYFHLLATSELRKIRTYILPLLMILAPAALVLIQPNLGTASVLFMIGGLILFAAGLPLWIVVTSFVTILSSVPVLWLFLHDYQKRRVFMFLNPESDPLGAGYHIIQSKIALGSGGIFGKGFLKGSQSYLNYLPEKQTDFIFTMFCEEFGLMGGFTLIGLYGALIAMGYGIAFRARSQFGRLLCLGVVSIVFIHCFINMAMNMDFLPVVGLPLPLMSYGGTSLLTLLLGFGFLLSVEAHPNTNLYRPSHFDL